MKGKINAETKSPGQFWAFFPTNNATKLTGILNAPWKTNEDRQNLLSCVLNYELIEAFAELVADSIQSLVLDLKDPCDYLEFLPGRLDEFMNWADNELNKKVYEAVALKPSLPDMNGNLVKPTEVKLHPANVPYEALDIWKACSDRPNNWCHHNVESPTRRARAERLLEQCKCDVASVSEWLEALSAKATPETSLAAIKAASKILLKGPTYYKSQILNSKIILDNSNQLVKPIPGSIFIAVDPTSHESGLRCVHPTVSSNKEGRDALATLGITEIDASSELQAFLLNRNLANMKEEDWPRFWQIIDRIDPPSALSTIKKWIGTGFSGNLRVRTRSGGFMPINETLLPGPIVAEDNHRDAKVIIDLNFHKNHKFILTELGAVDVPRANQGSILERWFDRFIQNARNRYMKNLQVGGSSPRQDLLEFTERVTVGPLLPLLHLSDEGKAILTRYILEVSEKEQPWVLKHSSNQKYRTMLFEPPSLWMVRTEGRLNSSLGFKRVSGCVSPSLGQWSRVFAVADCTENQALRLGLPSSMQNIQKQQWEQAFIEASKLDDIGYLGNFYASACNMVPNPEFIRCIKSNKFTLCAPSSVIVTHDSSLQKSLIDTGEAYLLVENSDKADSLVKNWKLLSPAIRGISKSIRSSPSGPDKPITDRFLGLSSKLSEQQAAYRLVPCSMLRQEVTTATGIVGTDTIFSLSGDTIYFSDKLGNSELLDRLTSALNIPLTSEERNEILQNRAVTEQRERAHRIRIKEKLNEKLLEAIGAKAVRQKLPKGLVNAAIGKFKDFKTNDLLAAELVMAVYGVETLKMFKEELTAVGLEPPHQWAGGNSTRRFVKNLGFPEEYAGFPEAERAEVLEVDGPPELPALHDFQETIVSRIRTTIKEQKRGLLSLPTGAGKTRVTVESIIRAYKEEGIPKLILWVAQSDELCEQAVQTWSEVWRGLGPKESLHINRLWASNEADYYTEGPQVVVATIDKLQGCLNDLNYDWLSNPQCVVIDEAHGATTPEYTRLLEWLGLERGKESRSLLGLTATPFRGGFHGGGEEETKALVNRFSARRLDQKVLSDDPYAELQSKGVLAHVEHKLLEGSVIKDLTQEELSHLAQFGRLPPAAADRLGSDASRNEILLGSIKELDKDWPILLFATSVDHASTMAAMLNSEGILAAAISGETDPGARRYYVEKFRRGGIRVLTNFGVLTAGFDAPAIRAVYVARPVFSPGLYQQMIGRGLRGPLNGGKERCLIVNVNDNFMQYGEKLAFTKFEYLWNS